MKVDIIDDLNMVIYLNKYKIFNLDFNKKEDLKEYFKQLFFNLKACYNIDINGFYNINIFEDEIYGLILEAEKEDLDYIDYFNGSVDMNIKLIKQGFLYEIDDYFCLDTKILNKVSIYSYKNKLYLKIKQKLTPMEMGKILEFSKIIYQDNVNLIIKKGKKINIKNVFMK